MYRFYVIIHQLNVELKSTMLSAAMVPL